MQSFKQFLVCGGNVQIGDVSAERIDLSKLNRASIVHKLTQTLKVVNLGFQKKYGLPLWNKEVFDSREFLSGSAFHFFDKAIPTPEFTKYKNTVGDVDTQVDKAQEKNLGEFLDSITGKTYGYVTFVGYKKSAGQYITLWAFSGVEMEALEDQDGNIFDVKGNKIDPSQITKVIRS